MKTIQEKIAIMQAFAEGKTIQCKYIDNWVDIPHPRWNWDYFDYRVKERKFEVGKKYRGKQSLSVRECVYVTDKDAALMDDDGTLIVINLTYIKYYDDVE